MTNYFRLLLFITLFLFFLKNETQAQTFKGGIITGLNFSKLSGDNLKGYNQYGLNFGGRIAVDPTERWRISLDILYSQKGSQRSVDQAQTMLFEKIELDYIDIPLMITFMDWMDRPKERKDYYRLHFTIGASVGWLINSKAIDADEIDITETQDFRKTVFNFHGGLVYFLNKHFGIGLLYSRSYKDIRNGNFYSEMLSRTVTLNTFYMF